MAATDVCEAIDVCVDVAGIDACEEMEVFEEVAATDVCEAIDVCVDVAGIDVCEEMEVCEDVTATTDVWETMDVCEDVTATDVCEGGNATDEFPVFAEHSDLTAAQNVKSDLSSAFPSQSPPYAELNNINFSSPMRSSMKFR